MGTTRSGDTAPTSCCRSLTYACPETWWTSSGTPRSESIRCMRCSDAFSRYPRQSDQATLVDEAASVFWVYYKWMGRKRAAVALRRGVDGWGFARVAGFGKRWLPDGPKGT